MLKGQLADKIRNRCRVDLQAVLVAPIANANPPTLRRHEQVEEGRREVAEGGKINVASPKLGSYPGTLSRSTSDREPSTAVFGCLAKKRDSQPHARITLRGEEPPLDGLKHIIAHAPTIIGHLYDEAVFLVLTVDFDPHQFRVGGIGILHEIDQVQIE